MISAQHHDGKDPECRSYTNKEHQSIYLQLVKNIFTPIKTHMEAPKRARESRQCQATYYQYFHGINL